MPSTSPAKIGQRAASDPRDPGHALLVVDSADLMGGRRELIIRHGAGTYRLRITAFIKARALRSDSIVVTVERQSRGANGQWEDATVAADVANNLENDILEQARQIHIARIRLQQ